MLNMLIAIMGDSFAFVTENKEKFSIKTKLDILISQAPAMIQEESEDVKDVFMIVVKPVDDEDVEQDEWHGSINKVVYMT